MFLELILRPGRNLRLLHRNLPEGCHLSRHAPYYVDLSRETKSNAHVFSFLLSFLGGSAKTHAHMPHIAQHALDAGSLIRLIKRAPQLQADATVAQAMPWAATDIHTSPVLAWSSRSPRTPQARVPTGEASRRWKLRSCVPFIFIQKKIGVHMLQVKVCSEAQKTHCEETRPFPVNCSDGLLTLHWH